MLRYVMKEGGRGVREGRCLVFNFFLPSYINLFILTCTSPSHPSLPPLQNGHSSSSTSTSTSSLLASPTKKRPIKVLGNKTEGALLLMADKYGVDYDKVRPSFPPSLPPSFRLLLAVIAYMPLD